MKYLKKFNETSGNFSKEIEIIYRDSNMVCLIPKSQKAAYIYGYRTKWCNVAKDRFDQLSFEYGILVIAFLFKDKYEDSTSYGYKLRLVYDTKTQIGDWGDNSGKHILDFRNIDPFEVKIKDEDTDMAKRAYNKITSIPEKCKNEVRKYLRNEKKVDFIRSDEYKLTTPKQKQKYEDKKRYLEFKHDTYPPLKELFNSKPGYTFDTKYDSAKAKFIIYYNIGEGNKVEEFSNFEDFYKKIENIIELVFN